MHWVQYEKLLLNRDHLSKPEFERLVKLHAEDERIGNEIANWWFPEILAGWVVLLLLASFLMPV